MSEWSLEVLAVLHEQNLTADEGGESKTWVTTEFDDYAGSRLFLSLHSLPWMTTGKLKFLSMLHMENEDDDVNSIKGFCVCKAN